MCGISGLVGRGWNVEQLKAMVHVQNHRGPDGNGCYTAPDGQAGLGHNRLSIIDLSGDGKQPMTSHDGNLHIVFNGEIYNYIELRYELKDFYPFISNTDTEVIIAAYTKWGTACLNKFLGMFSFAIWNEKEKELFAARDRFGVKPFNYYCNNDLLVFASEIKAIKAAGIMTSPNTNVWTTYFASGLYDHTNETFCKNIYKLPAGHYLTFNETNKLNISQWYDMSHCLTEIDERDDQQVEEEVLALFEDTIKLRFRADVPIGVCLSGGLDSSLLYALIKRVKGQDFPVHAFTFYTGYHQYDELSWARKITEGTNAITHACKLSLSEIPYLAQHIANHMDEPYGGIPTLGMSKVFATAKENSTKVLLDGNGIDEAWGGYEYYAKADGVDMYTGPVQGAKKSITLTNCLKYRIEDRDFTLPSYAKDKMSLLQYRDIFHTKIPRAMRFADRNSMAYSIELREPFLDHRIVELGLKQPLHRKVRNNEGKWLVRNLAHKIITKKVSEAPKRPVQTPQREWLGNELSSWADKTIQDALHSDIGKLFVEGCISNVWNDYKINRPDNSFYIWQLINLGLLAT